ncbi:MAG: FRG domain-containing protein [Flavobacterium sp.]|nr:MAG: FRG domain-containing protein [Flavobacterium sp.]
MCKRLFLLQSVYLSDYNSLLMRFNTDKVESISDLLVKLQGHIGNYTGPVWFRGQGDMNWSLVPKLMRLAQQLPESHYFNRFKQDASFILNTHPKSEFEWLFLMQHYGVSTRLLDWSESPLVALYFACITEENNDGALWVLLPTVLNLKSRYQSEYEFEIPSFDDEHLENYLPSTISREKKSSLLPMAAIAPRNSIRMQAQKGVFTISHREVIPIEIAGGDPDHIWKYQIPSDKKKLILDELKLLGINRFHLFPELESLSFNF